MAELSPEMLARLSTLLGQRSPNVPQQQDSGLWPSRARGRAAFGLRPETPPVSVAATPPALPPFQIPGTANSPTSPMPPFNPQQASVLSGTVGSAISTPQPPPQPPVVAPGDQPTVVPPMPPPTQIGPQAPESVWETMKRLFQQGQIPEGYRGAMGEMIKNG